MTTLESSPSTSLQPAERQAVFAIAGIGMLRMFGLFALLPVLAIYAGGLEGATPLLIGLAVGGYGLTQAALQIPFGALSDRIGRRPVIWFGLALFAAGSLVAGFSEHIHTMIAGRLLQGAGAVSATLSALMADVTRDSVRTRSMAVLGIGIGGSFLLALVFGPGIAAAFGTRSLFWMAIGLAIAAALLLTRVPHGETRITASRDIRTAFTPSLLVLDFYVFVLHAILTALFVALPFLLRDSLQVPLADQWELYVGALLASLLGTVPLILIDERNAKASTMAAALALLIGGLVTLLYADAGWWFAFLALALFFAGFNFLEASLPARLSLEAPVNVRGGAMGVFSSSQFLGAFAGGLVGGALYAGGGTDGVFAFCASAAAAWLLLHMLLQRRA